MRRLAILALGFVFFIWIIAAGAASRPYTTGQRDVQSLSAGDRIGLIVTVAPLLPAGVVALLMWLAGLPDPLRFADGVTGAILCGFLDAGLLLCALTWLWRRLRRAPRPTTP